MGVSIHYRGRINDISLVPELCEEITDIARIMKMPYQRLNDDWSEPPNASFSTEEVGTVIGTPGLKGISVSPHPDSESLALFFDREGYLRCPLGMLSIIDGSIDPDEAWVSRKTQFAGANTHIWMISILSYLKKKYIHNLEVSDEGEYWDTKDVTVLSEKIEFINKKMNWLSEKLTSAPVAGISDMTPEEIADYIEKLLNEDET